MVFSYINMNPPQVYMCSPSWTPLPSPCTIPLGHPSAPAPSIQYHALNLDWWFVSYMTISCQSEWLWSKSLQAINAGEGMEKRGTLLHCWWKCKLVQPLWRTVWRFLKKLEIELSYDPAIPLLGIHTKETRIERDTCTPMFITALFIIARTWKQPRCPSADEWIRKLGTYRQWSITQPLKRIHLNQF